MEFGIVIWNFKLNLKLECDFEIWNLEFNAEFEFNNSRALVDVFQIRDDVEPEQRLNIEKIDTAAGSGVVLPKALPFMFGQTEVVKKAYSTVSKGTFNQVQFRIEAEQNKIQLRGVKSSAIVMGLDAEKA